MSQSPLSLLLENWLLAMSENVFVNEKVFSPTKITFASLCVVHVIYSTQEKQTKQNLIKLELVMCSRHTIKTCQKNVERNE